MPKTQWLRNLFPKEERSTTFQVHAYRYRCSRWYGWVEGTRTVVLEPGADVENELHSDAKNVTASSSCSVTLLQMYSMTVGKIKPFPALGIGVHPPARRVPEATHSPKNPVKN